MTRRTLFQRAAAAFAGTVLARMPLAGTVAGSTIAEKLRDRIYQAFMEMEAWQYNAAVAPPSMPYGIEYWLTPKNVEFTHNCAATTKKDLVAHFRRNLSGTR